MSFLAPFFLLGAAAIALPIVFHLIRRSSRERIPFSSLMFLLPTPPRVTRRSKLENVLLLLLRCAVVCLLAFAFARPFFSSPAAPDPTGATGEKVLVLLDTSASMRRPDLWQQAKEKTRAVFKNAAAADQVACVTFDREVRSVMTFEQWSALALGERAAVAGQRVDALSPGWGATRLGHALISACEMFDTSTKDEQTPKRMVLITDLQEGSRLDGLQGFEWPRGVRVTLELLTAKRPSNAGLQLASEPEELSLSASEPGSRLRISNSSNSKREQFQIGWGSPGQQGFAGPAVDAYIPPGQSRVVLLPPPSTNSAPDRVLLTGDDDEFDNTVYVVPRKVDRTTILFSGADVATDPAQSLYYLRRAFQETRRLSAEVLSRAPGTTWTAEELRAARMMVINDPLPDDQIASVRSFLESDKAVLLCVSKLSVVPTLGRLVRDEALGGEEAGGKEYAMLGQIDFEHPLFAPFADPRYSDFTKIHFWKHRRVHLEQVRDCRVLARFDDGDVALAEIPVGKGKLWVLTASWHPQESQLALSSKFVPLLYAMLEQSGGVRSQGSHYSVGDVVTLPMTTDSVTVRKPDASEVQVGRGDKFTGTDLPGVYTVGANPATVSFAVNLAPEESRTAPLPLEELERRGVPLQPVLVSSPRAHQERKEHLQAAQLENRQKVWRWLLVVALLVLVMETWLAGRVTRRTGPMVPATD